ncbi:MAG: CHAT domain-containing protein, partial [Candidatus Eisenbacteria bacterium]
MNTAVRAGLACSMVTAGLLLAASPRAAPVAPSVRFAGVISRADSLVTMRRVPAAERYLDSLVIAARANGDRELEMVAVLRRAGSWLFTRNAAVAKAEAERGIVMARAVRDTGAWCRGLMVVQYAAFDAQEPREGESAARRLIGLSRHRGDREAEAVGHIGLGYGALQNQAFAHSAVEYRRAIALAQAAKVARHELRARVGLARAMNGLGRLDDARSENRNAIALAQRMKDGLAEADAWNNLGACEQRLGDPSLSPRFYERSVQLRRRMGAGTSNSVSNLALTQLQLGRYADAAATLMADRPSLGRSGTVSEGLLHARILGEVRLSQRRYAEAESLFTWCWLTADSLGSAEEAIPAGIGMLRYLSIQAEPARTVEFASRLLARYDSRLTFNDRMAIVPPLAQARLLLGQRTVAVQLLRPVAAEAETARSVVFPRRAELELVLAEALREREPDDALAHLARAARDWEAGRQALRTPEHREAQSIPSQLATLTSRVWLEGVRKGTPATRTVHAFEAVQRYKGRTLLERGSAVRGIERARDTWGFSLAAFQRSGLRPGEVLLDYSLERDYGYLFVVTPHRLAVHAMPGNDSLGVWVSRFRDIQRDPRSSVSLRDAATRELSRRLLGPAAGELGASTRVLVSPSASLGSVPFAVLTGPSGAPLEQTHELVNVPSAAWLFEERRRAAPVMPRLAVVGRTTDDRGRALEGVAGETRWLGRQFDQVATCVHAGDRPLDQVLDVMR